MNLRAAEGCEWAVLTAQFPGREPQATGILLREISRDEFLVRIRPGWWSVLSEEDEPEVWAELSEELERLASEMGARHLLDWLETTASHTLRISARQNICVLDAEATLDLLYRQHVLREPSRALISNPEPASVSQSENNDIVGGIVNWWAPAVLAAGLIIGAVIAGLQSRPITGPSEPSKAEIAKPVELFIPSGLPNRTLFLPANFEPHVSGHRQRRKHPGSKLPTHRRFQPELLAVKKQEPHTDGIDCPPPQVCVDLRPASAMTLPLPLSKPPRFRSRRFVRLLSALARPFKKHKSSISQSRI